MLAFVAFAPIQKLLPTSEVEAVVEARMITLLAAMIPPDSAYVRALCVNKERFTDSLHGPV
jgi:hypothetical protein